MDGLSAAASGIAVVSLAVQLVDSVREIRRFLRDVSEAPKELRRLIDLLEQLELILENIGALVERQQQGSAQTDVDMSDSILKAMRTCESKLKMLEDLVETAKKSTNAATKATRKFGSFKLACKKRDIEEFERQLHDATSLLNLAMMTNLTVVHSQGIGNLLEKVTATHQMTTTLNNNMLLLTSSTNVDTDYGLSATAVPRIRNKNRQAKGKLSKRRKFFISSFSGLFGRLAVRREVRDCAFDDKKGSFNFSQTDSESSWVFIPSFLPYAFDFRYINTCGYVEKTLRTYPTIQDSHPVWEMCENGNLLGIQKLLSAGQISPFCVDSYGRTLLHEAALCCQANLYEFLLEAGLTGEELDVRGHSCYKEIVSGITISRDQHVERMFEIIINRASNSDVTSSQLQIFSPYVFREPTSLFFSMFSKLLTEDNINDCLCPPLVFVAKRFAWSDPCQRYQLKPTIHHLVAIGADLHRGSRYNFTLLDDLMWIFDNPWDSISVGRLWLDILKEMQIDVVEYLRTEYSLHFDALRLAPMLLCPWYIRSRERYLIISEEPPSVRWDWFINPDEHAHDVLEEFKNFGPGEHEINSYYKCGDSMYNWPYFYPTWHYYAFFKSGNLSEEEIAAARHFEERFERRWHKKTMKLARAQGTTHRGPRMPGAWID